nr:NAD(P)-binding domain-containing protein [Polaromonas glacialis]
MGLIGCLIVLHGVRNSHEVMVSNSRDQTLLAMQLLPLNSNPASRKDAARSSGVVFIAVLFSKYHSLLVQASVQKMVVNANIYCPNCDGPISKLDSTKATTSELVVAHL